MLSPTLDDLGAGLALFEHNAALGAFDAVLAAAAVRAGLTAIVSADRAFAAVAQIAHVVPDHAGVTSLLAS